MSVARASAGTTYQLVKGGQMLMRAHHLLELLVVLALSMFLLGISLPLFSDAVERSRFKSFASELTAHVSMARQHAQSNETSVKWDLDETAAFRYRISVREAGDRWRPLSRSSWKRPRHRAIRNLLPSIPLTHPTTGRVLDNACSTSQKRALYFGPRGASGGTLVFSDGKKRAVCVVVSSQTGRFLIYLLAEDGQTWKAIF